MLRNFAVQITKRGFTILLNEVLSLNAQELRTYTSNTPMSMILNEVLSLNAQELFDSQEGINHLASSMKS